MDTIPCFSLLFFLAPPCLESECGGWTGATILEPKVMAVNKGATVVGT